MLEKLIYTSTTTDTSEGLVAQLANYLADSVYYTRDWSGHWLFYDKNDTAACFPKQITALSCFRVIWISEYCFWKISLVLTIVQFVESWFTFSKYFSSLVFGQWKKLGKIYKQINYRTSNVPLRYFYFFSSPNAFHNLRRYLIEVIKKYQLSAPRFFFKVMLINQMKRWKLDIGKWIRNEIITAP